MMAKRTILSDDQLVEIGKLFGVLQEPTRLRLLLLLKDGPRNVSQITEELSMKQANASKHLAILLNAGIISRKKVRQESVYAIKEKGIFRLCEIVCDQIYRKTHQTLKQFS